MSGKELKVKRNSLDLFTFVSLHEELDEEIKEKLRLREEFFVNRFVWNTFAADLYARGLDVCLSIFVNTHYHPINICGVIHRTPVTVKAKWKFVINDINGNEVGRADSFDTILDTINYIRVNYFNENFLKGVNNVHG